MSWERGQRVRQILFRASSNCYSIFFRSFIFFSCIPLPYDSSSFEASVKQHLSWCCVSLSSAPSWSFFLLVTFRLDSEQSEKSVLALSRVKFLLTNMNYLIWKPLLFDMSNKTFVNQKSLSTELCDIYSFINRQIPGGMPFFLSFK